MADLTFKQGDDVSQALIITRDGAALDITGATIVFNVSLRGESVDNVPMSIEDAAGGEARLTMTAAETAALTPYAGYRYEVEVLDGTGKTLTAAEGRLFVRADGG
jgi:hypothetical protein